MKITKNLRTINLNETQDNLTSSRDSINAIPPSDIEQLETDCEDNINRISVPFTEQSYREDCVKQNINNILKPNELGHMPVVNSQTCFVSGNNNMILNHLNDNFAFNEGAGNNVLNNKTKTTSTTTNSMKKSRNKDLEKRKLSQNLDNFSLRLGHQVENDTQKKSSDKFLQTKKDQDNQLKDSKNTMKTSNQSGEEKHSTE